MIMMIANQVRQGSEQEENGSAVTTDFSWIEELAQSLKWLVSGSETCELGLKCMGVLDNELGSTLIPTTVC
jgi:hypothetical protein